MGSAVAGVTACSGDGGSSGSGGSSSATSGPGSGGAGGAGQGGAEQGSGGAGQGGGDVGGGDVGGGGAGGGAGGSGPDCSVLGPAPIKPAPVTDILQGSEDLAFDGKGNIAAKDGDNIVLLDAMGMTTVLAPLSGTVYGVRYRSNGDLLAALPTQGKIVQITPGGDVSDFVTGLASPNGIYPDLDDNVWVTQFGGNKVTRINPDKTMDDIVTGNDADAANGVVFDKARSLLFYTNYQAGMVRSVKVPPSGAPAVVATIAGAKLDGLVMDACGNLYVVNQGGNEMYRIKLDAAGAAVGEPELLAGFPKNVANAQFGSGPGFDAMTLYAVGAPGSIYAVPVGVPGAPIPTAP
jgi:sugar lactone lactonase YvrE